MKTYKEFKEAAALALPALKAAGYVIPALGAGANILKGMMQSDASDKFKARQRPGRTSSAADRQRRQAREDRRAEAQRRARENTPKKKEVEPTIPTAKKEKKQKVDPRLERAAGQILDRLRNESVLPEQMVAPKKPGKRDLLNLTPSEKKLDAIIQLSNRPGVRRRLMTGKAMYPFSEDNKHREDKLNYQYKEVTNPKKPVDPVRALKLKKV